MRRKRDNIRHVPKPAHVFGRLHPIVFMKRPLRRLELADAWDLVDPKGPEYTRKKVDLVVRYWLSWSVRKYIKAT